MRAHAPCVVASVVPKIKLPGTLVRDIACASRRALVSFAELEADTAALEWWRVHVYRPALVGATTAFVSDARHIVEAQHRLVAASSAAHEHRAGFVDHVAGRVYVARIEDRQGERGYGPIDVAGLSLESRILSLLVVDVLMHPSEYAAPKIYAQQRLPAKIRGQQCSGIFARVPPR